MRHGLLLTTLQNGDKKTLDGFQLVPQLHPVYKHHNKESYDECKKITHHPISDSG
jgi:hypothetical protein